MKKRRGQHVTRRKVVKGMLAACVAGGASQARGAPATTQVDAISVDDLAAVDRVIGRGFSAQQHKQMLGIVTTRRKKYLELRKIPIDPNVAPAIRFVQQATLTIPIVMMQVGDAVDQGFVVSLAHPGGNITGTSWFGPELSAKRLELMKEALSGMAQVAILREASAGAASVTAVYAAALARLTVTVCSWPR